MLFFFRLLLLLLLLVHVYSLLRFLFRIDRIVDNDNDNGYDNPWMNVQV